MDQKICLDTDVCIAILKEDKSVKGFLDDLSDCEGYLSSITVFELLLRDTNLDVVKRFIESIQIIEFTKLDGIKSSSIFKDLKKRGLLIDIRDVFIASSCLSNHLILATFNKKHFERIKGLKLYNF